MQNTTKRLAPMLIRYLLLTLLLALAPAIAAKPFPPCSDAGIEFTPLNGHAQINAVPWLSFWYWFGGRSAALIQALQEPCVGENCHSGSCRGNLPVPNGDHVSTGWSEPHPESSRLGYGVLALPELRVDAEDGLNIRYRLELGIENSVLAKSGDWFDLAQLEFQWNAAQIGDPNPRSSAYRVRKRQGPKGVPFIEVIESRVYAWNPGVPPPVSQRVVATIHMNNAAPEIPVTLRWRQRASLIGGSIGGPGIVSRKLGGKRQPVAPASASTANPVTYHVDSTFEVLGANQTVLYTTSLPDQWAAHLWIGLLDYNVPSRTAYPSSYALTYTKSFLHHERLP